MSILHNKVILVTGASQGIGAACSDLFAQNGAKSIFMVDSDFESVNQMALKTAAKNGCKCIPIEVDATEEREIKTAYEIITDKEDQLDILVNCMGFGNRELRDENDIEPWDFAMDIGLRCAFMFSKEAIKMMKKNNSGTIISAVSLCNDMSGAKENIDQSSFSHAGLVYLTKSIAIKAAKHGITVKGVSAMIIQNEEKRNIDEQENVIVFSKSATIQEVADTVLFLASDHARHMSGTCIDVSGNLAI